MSLPATDKFYRYRLLFTSADGSHYVPANTSSSTNATASRTVNQTPIDPFGYIVYYGYTTAIDANARPGTSYLWIIYTLSLGYSFNRTGAALTLTSWAPVYIKCTPQANGSAIIDADTPYVQSLPTTADGKIYIFLGVAYSATNIELLNNHPVYYHDGTGIRLWTGKTIPTKTSELTNDSNFVQSTSLATVATSGSYNDLTNKPTIPAAITVDSTITQNGTNPVQGGAIYSALQGKEDRQKFMIDLVGTPPTDAEIIAALHDPKKDVTLRRDYENDLIVELRHYSTMPYDDGYYHYFCCIDSINNILYSFVYYEEDGSINQDDAFSTSIPFDASDIGAVPTTRKINNKPLSSDITLTASDIGALPNTTTIPTVPTNVSSFTNDAGYLTSHQDISGKADKSEMSVSTSSDTTTITLKSGTSATVINQHNIVVGKLQNGNFYKGTYLAQVVPGTWAFSSTAEVGNFNKIYVDVLTNSIYKYEGSYVSVTGDFVTYDQYNIDIQDLWENKADVIQVVTVSTTGAVTQALEPNTFYQFTGNPTSLTLTLTSGTGLCVYAGKFTAGTGFSNLSLPASVKEADGIPSIEAGNTYEFSIMDNLLLLVKEGS